MTRITVLLADDHHTVRQGLRMLIDGQPDMEVVGEAADGRAALERAQALRPRVVVVDISMPEMNGLAATRSICQSAPGTAVVALTRYSDEAYVQELLAAGACGYVLKQSSSEALLAAIRAASRGEHYLDSTLARRETGAMMRRSERSSGPRISDREREVLRLMALGYSNKEIAGDLNLSVKTVEVHKANAMRKLNLAGRIDVIKYASLQGWLQDP